MNEIEGRSIQSGRNHILSRIIGTCGGNNYQGIKGNLYPVLRSGTGDVSCGIYKIEPNINDTVIERTDFIVEDNLLHDEETEEVSEAVKEFFERNHLSELDRRIENMDKREMTTVCCVAIRKYPLAYLQVIAEYIMELIKDSRKGRKK